MNEINMYIMYSLVGLSVLATAGFGVIILLRVNKTNKLYDRLIGLVKDSFRILNQKFDGLERRVSRLEEATKENKDAIVQQSNRTSTLEGKMAMDRMGVEKEDYLKSAPSKEQ